MSDQCTMMGDLMTLADVLCVILGLVFFTVLVVAGLVILCVFEEDA